MNSIEVRLRNLANNVSSKEVKTLIQNYLDLNVTSNLNDPQARVLIYEALEGHADKNKKVKQFLDAEVNRNAIFNLGIGHALASLKKTKLYKTNNQAKRSVDEIVSIKEADAADFKIIDAFTNNINQFQFDSEFKEKMDGVHSKYDQFKTYALVENAIEALTADPNHELYGDVMMKLENAMALPASMVPAFICRGLADYSNVNPVIKELITHLGLINKATQKHTLNNVKYVGNARVYESVISPVLHQSDKSIFMINNALYSMTGDDVEEQEIDKIEDEQYLQLCNEFSVVNASTNGFELTDQNHIFRVSEDEDGAVVEMDDEEYRVESGWQSELIAAGANPNAVNHISSILGNKKYLNVLDNVIKLDSTNDSGYQMYIITTGKKRHILVDDAKTQQKVIMKNVDDDEVMQGVLDAFGADISMLLDSIESEDENEEMMKEINDEIDEIKKSLELIYEESEEVQEQEDVKKTKEELESRLEELETQRETLMDEVDQEL